MYERHIFIYRCFHFCIGWHIYRISRPARLPAHNAQEALGLHLFGMEQDGETIPAPTPINKIALEKDQVPALISVYMPLVRNQVQTASVKKTLTIPAWLNALAEKNNINFSQTLQTALKDMLQAQK